MAAGDRFFDPRGDGFGGLTLALGPPGGGHFAFNHRQGLHRGRGDAINAQNEVAVARVLDQIALRADLGLKGCGEELAAQGRGGAAGAHRQAALGIDGVNFRRGEVQLARRFLDRRAAGQQILQTIGQFEQGVQGTRHLNVTFQLVAHLGKRLDRSFTGFQDIEQMPAESAFDRRRNRPRGQREYGCPGAFR